MTDKPYVCNKPYTCCVVEVRQGQFKVAAPGDCFPGGRFFGKEHVQVLGGTGQTLEQFREDVGDVVNRLLTKTSPQRSTLADIHAALATNPQYDTFMNPL